MNTFLKKLQVYSAGVMHVTSNGVCDSVHEVIIVTGFIDDHFFRTSSASFISSSGSSGSSGSSRRSGRIGGTLPESAHGFGLVAIERTCVHHTAND